MKDQAERLREKVRRSQGAAVARTIAVTSGKGGVGKSNVALNLALSLMERGKRTLLFDLDLGFANLDVLLGHTPRLTLIDMVEKGLSLDDVIERGPYGLELISGGSGLGSLFHLDQGQINDMLDKMDTLSKRLDYIILDTGAGLSSESLRLLLAVDDIWLVTTPEPTSMTDAYGVIKALCKYNGGSSLHVIVNRCYTPVEGIQTARRLQTVAKQFLNKEVRYLGHLPQDPSVHQAVLCQKPFIKLFPACQAAQAIAVLTARYLNQPLQENARREGRGLRSFFKQLIAPFVQKGTG